MLPAQANTTIASKIPSYTDYWAAGLAVIPLNNGVPLKGSNISRIWTENWKPSEDDLFDWSLSPTPEFAIVCGKVSGVVAVDLDHVTDIEMERVKRILGETPCAKVGSKGLTLFYKYNNEINTNFGSNPVKVELLSDRRQTTIPPSKHRSKDLHYKWVGKPLLECHKDLPKLPHNWKELLDSALSIVRPPEREYKRIDYDFSPSYQDALDALNHCDPNCSNDVWVQIGMAFRAEVGDAGFHDFDIWSSKGASYDKKTIRARWKSFNSRSITYGTLVHFAQQGGYKVPRKEAIARATLSPEEYSRSKLAYQAEIVEESEEIPELITKAPRLIRLLAEWMYKSAPHPQPMLSLGAAITTVGFLMGRDFMCEGSGIKANLYSICIAGSQEGKQEIVTRARTVMKEFDLMKNYQTSWTSGAAIENVMSQTDGQVFYITDEMGILMNQLVGKHTSANQQEAVAILLRLYTENYFKGKAYAKSADQETVEIANPFVSICGFTQREPFFDAMTSMQAHTGVLNRMCLFKAPDVRPKYNPNNTTADRYLIPDEVKKELKLLQEKVPQLKVGKEYISHAKEVGFTDEAKEMLHDIIIGVDERFRKSQMEGENIHLFIGRVPEVIQKVALIGSCGTIITKEVMLWAKSIVDYTVGLMIKYSSDIVDSDFERKKNQALQFIMKRGGTVTKTDFTNCCKVFHNRKEREDILADLIDAGKLEVVKIETSSKPHTAYRIVKAPIE